MPTLHIEYLTFCAWCGDKLEGYQTLGSSCGKDTPFFYVTACTKCVKSAYDKGYEAGKIASRESQQ